MPRFKLVQNEQLQIIEFHTEPSATSTLVEDRPRLLGGMVVEPTGKTAEAGTWIEVDHQKNPAAEALKGWIEAAFLGGPVNAGPTNIPPVDEAAFVAECVRCEVTSEDESTVGADYLIAWALLETSLTDFSAHLHTLDAIGPYQISESEWNDYLKSGLNLSPGPDGRFSGYAQIDCAAWIAERDAAVFSKAMASVQNPAREYIPSLLNIFHSLLVCTQN